MKKERKERRKGVEKRREGENKTMVGAKGEVKKSCKKKGKSEGRKGGREKKC